MTNPEPVPLELSSPNRPTASVAVVMLTTLLFTAW
jgi:hypothetical protein